QWKFFIHTLLQSLSAKRTSWNEFSTAMASAVICLSKVQKFNFSKYIFDSLVHNVASSSKFYMYPRFIQLIIQNQIGDLSTHTTRYISPVLTQKVFENIRWVGKGFSGVGTPLFEGMLAAREIAEEEIAEEQVQADDAVEETVAEDVANEAIPSTPTPLILPSPPSHDLPSTSQVQYSPPQHPQSSPQAPPQGAEFPTHLFQQVLDTCFALTLRVENLEHDKAAQKLEIIKLKARVKRLERANKVKSSKLRRLKKVGTSQRIGAEFPTHIQQILDVCSALTRRVKNSENDKAAQKLEIIKLKARVKRLEKANKVKSSKLRRLRKIWASKRIESSDDMEDVFNQGRMIDDLDKVEGIELVKDADIAKTKGRHAAEQTEKQAEIYHLDLDHSSKPMKKKDQIELDAEYARKLHKEINKDQEEINKYIDWDAVIDHVNQKFKNPQYIKRYQGMKKRPQTESECNAPLRKEDVMS
nr:hypothetical protein [Tanacetum cinerariifolium]